MPFFMEGVGDARGFGVPGVFRFAMVRRWIGPGGFADGPNVYLAVEWYLLAASFAAMPALWAWRRSRRPRVEGTCVCGYDLRATPDKCPECGAIASVNPGR